MEQGTAKLEVSALPKKGQFHVTFKDGFGEQFTHGPCKIGKGGQLVYIDKEGKTTPVQAPGDIIGYTIVEEHEKMPFEE